jgi:hypothetical protein
MPGVTRLIAAHRRRRRIRRARLPWRDLEAEAARQGCSPPDIFFDWTGAGVSRSGEERAAAAQRGS